MSDMFPRRDAKPRPAKKKLKPKDVITLINEESKLTALRMDNVDKHFLSDRKDWTTLHDCQKRCLLVDAAVHILLIPKLSDFIHIICEDTCCISESTAAFHLMLVQLDVSLEMAKIFFDGFTTADEKQKIMTLIKNNEVFQERIHCFDSLKEKDLPEKLLTLHVFVDFNSIMTSSVQIVHQDKMLDLGCCSFVANHMVHGYIQNLFCCSNIHLCEERAYEILMKMTHLEISFHGQLCPEYFAGHAEDILDRLTVNVKNILSQLSYHDVWDDFHKSLLHAIGKVTDETVRQKYKDIFPDHSQVRRYIYIREADDPGIAGPSVLQQSSSIPSTRFKPDTPMANKVTEEIAGQIGNIIFPTLPKLRLYVREDDATPVVSGPSVLQQRPSIPPIRFRHGTPMAVREADATPVVAGPSVLQQHPSIPPTRFRHGTPTAVLTSGRQPTFCVDPPSNPNNPASD